MNCGISCDDTQPKTNQRRDRGDRGLGLQGAPSRLGDLCDLCDTRAESCIVISMRRILHVDMDAFYASVEQRDDPSLRGRPIAVGGSPAGRGVVCAASYEARAVGGRSATPMARGVGLCPDLVIVRPDSPRYRAISQQVFAIFGGITP